MAEDRNPVLAHAENMRKLMATLIPADRPAALVDYPDYANIGDHAIWLGTKRLLAGLGVAPAYQCAQQDYDPAVMARRIGDHGTILLQGGGNFGDLYRHQAFRQRVLADFPRHKIIGLPQTALFMRNEEMFKSIAAFAKASAVTLFARDLISHHLMKQFFGRHAQVLLAPDMSLLLGALPRVSPPIADVLWLGRQDDESVTGRAPDALAEWQPLRLVRVALPTRADGIAMELTAAHGATGALLTDWPAIAAASPHAEAAIAGLDREARSSFYLDQGLAILALGRVVVTDRLHGHLLCLLMGIPHVLLNNNNGKTWNYYETWTRGLPHCYLARDAREAWEIAQGFVRALDAQAVGRA